MKPAPYFEKISYFCRNYALLTELSHVGKLREVREVRGKLRDKCPTFYERRLLSLHFPNDRRE